MNSVESAGQTARSSNAVLHRHRSLPGPNTDCHPPRTKRTAAPGSHPIRLAVSASHRVETEKSYAPHTRRPESVQAVKRSLYLCGELFSSGFGDFMDAAGGFGVAAFCERQVIAKQLSRDNRHQRAQRL